MSIDGTRALQLITGIAGIYISYLVTGIIHESMIKGKYLNNWTGVEQTFSWPSAFLIFPCGMTWGLGYLINSYQIDQQSRTSIPNKNSAICGFTVAVSTLTYTYAIYLTNYPVVMMFKSCNILSVILVGVLCSRVADKRLKLGPKKIAVGVMVTLGIVIFKFFDPQGAKKEEKKTQILGIVLLIVSMLADGFLPDFQAQIKTVFKPLPMQMMVQINKWVTIISLIFSLVLWQFIDICEFILSHRLFLFHMIVMGVLALVGQMFVYRMIKQFKQHFVPFVITTRKVFTVALSIFFYDHETNFMQILGILMVFGIVTFEFVTDLMEPAAPPPGIPEPHPAGGTDLSLQQQNGQKSPAAEVTMSDQISKNQGEIYKNRITSNQADPTPEAPTSSSSQPQLIEVEDTEA